MATPKIQNAYRNPSSDTEDIADLLLVTTSGLATDGDAGASFIVFHNGSNDVLVSSSNALPVSVSGVATAANQSTANGLLTTIDADTGAIATHAATLAGAVSGTEMQVDIVSGTVTVTGVSTLAEQQSQTTLLGTIDTDTGAIATSVASLDSKTPALGQALAAASVPVVLTAAQLSTLTPPAAITGFATEAKQPALGTAGTPSTDVLTVQGHASMTALKVDGSAVTQPVSGSVTANIGTVGTLATAAKQDTGNTSLATLAGAVSGTEVQVDIVTMPAVTISGTVTVGSHAVTNAGTFAVQVDGAALTSLQLLDDSVATVASAITSKGMAAVGTDGTNARILKTDTNGELQVDVLTMPSVAVTNAGTFAVQESGAALTALQLIDDAVVTDGGSPSKFIAIAGYDEGDTGQMQALACDANGSLSITALNAIGVKGGEVHDSGPMSQPMIAWAGRASAAAPSAVSTDLDAVYPWHSLSGAYMVNQTFAGVLATTGNGASGTGVQRVTIANDSTGILAGVTTVTTLTGGGVAHDGADSGNPVKVGARAAATLSDDTMVANADRTDAVSDLDGALIVRSGFPLGDLITERVTNTDGASTAFTNFGATASARNYVTAISVYNSSATAGTIDFRDGTGGSVLWTVPIPATGGAVISGGGSPLFYTTANTALAYDVSAALTTVTISISGFKSKARA